jgi:2-oxoglutarate dehydrogenase E2 component (dihydrolipoamide succinyltransferase)
MSHQIKIPPVGESVVSALVARWHVADGATVEKGQTLVTLETDKVSNELEAEVAGTVSITVQEGQEVEIGTVIGLIAEGAASGGSAPAPAPETQAAPQEAPAPVASGPTGEKIDIVVPAAGESITSATVAAWAVSNNDFVKKGQVLVTLDTDKVSSELEAEASGVVSIEVSEGTEVSIGEKLGSIAVSDAPASPALVASDPEPVKAAAPAVPTPAPAPVVPASAPKLQVVQDDDSRVTRRKMTPLRRKIAQHLVNAQQTAAILTTFNEVDMTAVMNLRKSVQEDFVGKHGVKLGFMSLFTKAVVQALKDVPSINARIEGNEIIENHFYDIGIAIGTEKGLIVPVVRDCDQKSFAQIEKDIIEYAVRSKEGKIELSDLSGGVFTISNGGVYGSLLSTPILNPPQSGILGMHTIQQRPMAVDGKVEIRPMMYLALSYDHRLVDGKEAVTFLIRIKDCLENPTRMMLEM